MNLRIDKNSIRVRVTEDEYNQLLISQELVEYLPFFDSNLIVKVSDKTEEKISVGLLNNEDFEMQIPKLLLLPSGQPIELSSDSSSYGSAVKLSFEVDRFTRKKVIYEK